MKYVFGEDEDEEATTEESSIFRFTSQAKKKGPIDQFIANATRTPDEIAGNTKQPTVHTVFKKGRKDAVKYIASFFYKAVQCKVLLRSRNCI